MAPREESPDLASQRQDGGSLGGHNKKNQSNKPTNQQKINRTNILRKLLVNANTAIRLRVNFAAVDMMAKRPHRDCLSHPCRCRTCLGMSAIVSPPRPRFPTVRTPRCVSRSPWLTPASGTASYPASWPPFSDHAARRRCEQHKGMSCHCFLPATILQPHRRSGQLRRPRQWR